MSPVTVPGGLRLQGEAFETGKLPDVCVLNGRCADTIMHEVLHENGWALILLDSGQPITHAWAEAGSDASAPASEHYRQIRGQLQ